MDSFRVLDYVLLFCGGLMTILWGMQSRRVDVVEAELAKSREVHQALEVRIAGEYVTRTDIDKFSEALFKKLDKIEELLHSKQDKA